MILAAFIAAGCNDAPPPVLIDTHWSFTCRVVEGQLECWGVLPVELGDPSELEATSISVRTRNQCVIHGGTTTCRGDTTNGVNSAVHGLGRITVGVDFACGVTEEEGSLVCWGEQVPVEEAFPGSIVGLDAGTHDVCVIVEGGDVRCWGNQGSVLEVPPDFEPAAQVAVGSDFACMLDAAGIVTCWGPEDPLQDKPLDRSYALIDATETLCAATSDGSVECRVHGFEEGEGTYAPSEAYGELVGLAAGYGHYCVLTVEDEVFCAGDNESGQASPP